VAQVVECLPSKCEAPSSNPSMTKKQKQNKAKRAGSVAQVVTCLPSKHKSLYCQNKRKCQDGTTKVMLGRVKFENE
jgi:hypothetical protein